MQASLVYPIPPAPRTAILIPGFRSKGAIRVFENGWTEETNRFDPQSITARLDQLFALERIANPTHALIAIRREWEPAISDADRERLWRAFRVPLFEQIVDDRCFLLAAECEAHEGLHIESRHFIVGDHEIERTPCGCGKKSPRFIERHFVRQAAASL